VSKARVRSRRIALLTASVAGSGNAALVEFGERVACHTGKCSSQYLIRG